MSTKEKTVPDEACRILKHTIGGCVAEGKYKPASWPGAWELIAWRIAINGEGRWHRINRNNTRRTKAGFDMIVSDSKFGITKDGEK